MTLPDYDAWFRAYAEAVTCSLETGVVQVETIRSYYAETVLALEVGGSLNAANSADRTLAAVLEHLNEFYAAIGTHSMTIDRIDVSPLYENHDRVQVFYAGHYDKPDGSALIIPFDVVYLVQRRATGPTIFAFIVGDETGLYRQHGLIDERGDPVPRV